jgi:hypothetical protein
MIGNNAKWLAIGAGFAAVAIGVASAQNPLEPLPDWVLQLARVRSHLKANFERIPNYVCQENVERFERKPGRAAAVKVDSMQFDVAMVEHKELLARPGAGGFQDKDLSAYISSGMLETGQFSSLPLNLFASSYARIRPHREAAGRPVAALSYDFEIPAFLSKFTLAGPRSQAVVGERGTFWVDAGSLDLIRIEDHAVDVPPAVGMSEVGSTVEYARMQIAGSNMLLPQSAELVVMNLDGREMRNRIEFSRCREYGSESTVRFGDLAEPPPAGKKQ